MSRMTYMRSWKSIRLTSHTWLGLNPQIGRPLSRIVVPLVYYKNVFIQFNTQSTVYALIVIFGGNLQISVQFLYKSFSKIFLRIQKKCLPNTQTSCCLFYYVQL
jgi:hypothetical protein